MAKYIFLRPCGAVDDCDVKRGVCSFPSAHVQLTKRQQLLMMGQPYKIHLDLDMPESPTNRELGKHNLFFFLLIRYGDQTHLPFSHKSMPIYTPPLGQWEFTDNRSHRTHALNVESSLLRQIMIVKLLLTWDKIVEVFWKNSTAIGVLFLGMFMVCVEFLSKDGKILANSCRSTMLHYRGYLLDTLYKLFYSPFFVFGSSEEKQTVRVELFADYEETEVRNLISKLTSEFNNLNYFIRFFYFYW